MVRALTRRASALAVVGLAAAASLTLGVAAPAQAVDLASLRSYMLTVPPSVYSGAAGYSAAEQTVYRDLARNTPDKDDVVAPAAPSKGWVGGVAGSAAIWAGGTALLSAGGTLGTVFTVNPQQMKDRYEEQGLSDNDWWTQFNCERMGDDWLGSAANAIQDWWTGLIGVDCEAATADDLDKNPDWQPLANEDPAGVAAGYPGTAYGCYYATPDCGTLAFDVVWSDYRRTNGGTVLRQEGWVLKVTPVGGQVSQTFTVGVKSLSSAGVLGAEKLYYGKIANAPSGSPGGAHSLNPAMVSVPGSVQYLVLSNLNGTAGTWTESSGVTMSKFDYTGSKPGGSVKVPGQLPYVNPTDGTWSPEAQEQVFLTTVETADGNTFTCRTRPFLETDADVPKPCDPTVPAGQWEVSRTVEMIPANAPNWVSGSDPRRIMTDQQTPQEYRNWRTAFPSCATEVCLMDLRSPAGSCFDQGDACNGWATDPDRASKYTCTYDGQSISLSECEAAYPHVFDQTKRDQGQAYPQPSGAPATSSPIQTSTSPAPVTAPGSWPASPEQPRNCFPTGWGVLNPIEWVYKPVKCAMEWAFVPRQSYVDNVIANMRFVWTSSSLVGLLGVLEDGADLFLGPTGCEGPAISLNVYGSSYSGHPLSACSDPFATAASFSFIFTGVAAWVMAVASIARSIGGVVAFKGIGGDDS